jgi:hypothetical protein
VIRRHRFGVADLVFELATDHEELFELWRRYSARFPASGEPSLTYTALVRPQPSFTVSDAVARGVERAVDLFAVLEGAFLADLIRLLGKEADVLHAAALADGDRATVFLGAPDAGKSTLCVELVREGLVYLSDELVVLDGDQVVALPRPISLTDEARSADLRPDDDERFEQLGYEYVDPEHRSRRAMLYLPRPPLVARAGERFALGEVVLLERGASGPPSRRVLEGAELRARLALGRFAEAR